MSGNLIERLRQLTVEAARGSRVGRRGMTLREVMDALAESREIRGKGVHCPDWAGNPKIVAGACCRSWQYAGIWHTCRYSEGHENMRITSHFSCRCTCGRERSG